MSKLHTTPAGQKYLESLIGYEAANSRPLPQQPAGDRYLASRKAPVASKGRQSWQVGDVVKVGFVQGLEVVKAIPTPGDANRATFVLWQPKADRFYRFTPHSGLVRCGSLAEACV